MKKYKIYTAQELQQIYSEIEREIIVTLPENKGKVYEKFSRKYEIPLSKVKKRPAQKREIRKLPQLFPLYAETHKPEKKIRAK